MQMIRKSMLAAAALLALAAPAQAQEMTAFKDMPAGKYELEKTHASLVWKVSHMGLSHYTARFKSYDAVIDIDPANPAKSTVKASIDPFQLETDYPKGERDFNLELAQGEKWFNAVKHPKITFESTKVEVTGADTAKITGNLELLGVKKPVVLDVKFNGAFAQAPVTNRTVIGFSATTTIKRSEWGMGNYVPMIGDDVAIAIEAEFVKSGK